MHHFGSQSGVAGSAAQLHQATGVTGRDDIGIDGGQRFEFPFEHGLRHFEMSQGDDQLSSSIHAGVA